MAKIARVCLIGPESTGKSALAERLAEHFCAPWIREFAREYAEGQGSRLTYEDVEPIARGELKRLEIGDWRLVPPTNLQSPISNLLILDTDLISTVVYSRHYYGNCPGWIADEARTRRADLYLLLDTDVPWVADAARDAGGDAREDLFDAFRRALDDFETRWVIISGSWDERFHAAAAEIAKLIA